MGRNKFNNKEKGYVSFKNLIMISVFVIYILVSIVTFNILYNSNVENLENKLISENTYLAKVANEILEEEKNELLIGARIIASDEAIYQAFKNNKYIPNNWDVKKDEIIIKTKEMNKFRYINLANLQRNKLYGMGRGSEENGVELFDKDRNFLGKSNFFLKEFEDTGNEKYIKDILKKYSEGLAQIALIQKNGEEFYIKGLAAIGLNSRFLVEEPYGAVIMGKKLDEEFLEKLKRKLNREVIIYSDEKIITSTLFKVKERLENRKTDKLEEVLVKNYEYLKLDLNKKNYGFTFLKVKNYFGKTIAYIGIGFDYSIIDSLNRESFIRFIIVEIITFIILFVILLIILHFLFKPFSNIVESIRDFKEGNYNEKIKKSGFGELEDLIGSINNMAEVIETRENELLNLNHTLEEKVKARTRDFYAKNSELVIILEKIKDINRRNEEEMEVARRLLRQIFQFEITDLPCYKILVKNISTVGIGGDFVYKIDLKSGKTGVIFADLAGHGVAAALMISGIKAMIDLYFKYIDDPSEALYKLNDIFNREFIPGVTISITYLIFDNKSEKISISLAAQEEVLLINSDEVVKLRSKGIILGVLESDVIKMNEELSFKTTELNLKVNDKIFLFTDGLIESKHMDRQQLVEKLDKLKNKKLEEIYSDLEQFIEAKFPIVKKDDITYLILEKSC